MNDRLAEQHALADVAVVGRAVVGALLADVGVGVVVVGPVVGGIGGHRDETQDVDDVAPPTTESIEPEGGL